MDSFNASILSETPPIQEKQINNLKSTVASLQSEIREYKKLLGNE